ncbi:ABC transporter ATP-binding protein [Allokutzneria multivorans]|uniref:ABC transporter ATP-binding protein n=1 Tax=Allokutzneria multivorans TaxID=1142134 RepID=A0ABP7R8L0_9PSEU
MTRPLEIEAEPGRARKLLGSLLRPHRARAIIAMVLVLAENAAHLAGPLLIAGALDIGVPAAVKGNPTPIAWFVAGYAASSLLTAGLRWGFLMTSGRVGQDVLIDLRGKLFTHSQRLSLSFHQSYTSGKMIARATSDIDTLSDLIDEGLDGLISSALTVIGVTVLMLSLDHRLALIVLAGFVPLVLATLAFRKASAVCYRRTRTEIAKVITQFTETMTGIRAVQAYRREEANAKVLDEHNDGYRVAQNRATWVLGVYLITLRLVGSLSFVIVLAVGAWLVSTESLAVGVLAAFLIYVRLFYDPLEQLGAFLNTYASANAALEKISGVLAQEPGVPEPARPTPLPSARGELRMSAVSFRYSDETPIVLSGMDLRVPAGQTLAVVGATGAGKSSLVKLFARFYDPEAGVVSLDGVDLRELSDEDLRRAVVMVTQESFLFTGSVAENIALGKPSAERSEIEAAASAVGAHSFISTLPEGYDTDVNKHGSRLSSGQRQLVAFARAFLADPAVLILDEATSSLDIPTERAVQEALETVLRDRTAVIIAHRLSTVLIADRVLVMERGGITEDGSPEELLGRGGEFASLHSAWTASLA